MRNIRKIVLHGNNVGFGNRPFYSAICNLMHLSFPLHYEINKKGEVEEKTHFSVESKSDKGALDIGINENFYDKEPTENQLESLAELVVVNCERHDIPVGRVYTHREIFSTPIIDCLGAYFDPIKFYGVVWERDYKKRILENRGNDEIVFRNLRLMSTKGRGHMPDLVGKESIGGSGGSMNGLTCTGANFYFDELGEIQYFENLGHGIPIQIDKLCNEGIFRIAVNLNTDKCYRIIEIHLRQSNGRAKNNLEESAKVYNILHGF